MNEVHEANSRTCEVAWLRPRRQQRLHDGMDDGAEVRVGLSGEAVEQLLRLCHVVLAVVLQQSHGEALQELLVLLLPVRVVAGLTCSDQNLQLLRNPM